jgi:cell division protein FtsZ
VAGITNLITTPGLINVDFADVKTVMSGAGTAVMGIGRASGDERAQQAANRAISSPLLETSMEGARGVLLSVAGPSNMTLHEATTAANVVASHADADADVIFGAMIDDDLGEEMRVTVIAAGFERSGRGRASRRPVSAHSTPGAADDDLEIPSFVKG